MAKVTSAQLERKAIVYVRQSSPGQVRNHQESGRRQHGFRERAVSLGWRREQVEVIDDDTGQSGATAEGRDGFQRLVSEVALGKVGAVLGLEVSRLARSCADWYRMMEVAAVTRTIIVDEDGVYDPNHFNDRLLLGLKATMSEAELHLLKQRMVGGRRNKARRGQYRIRLPAGYVWEEGEGIRKDPDERVQDVIVLFFRSFERLGTAASVARYFAAHRQPFPRRDGWGSLEVSVTWGALSVSRAVNALKSPVYAGIYCYDRNSTREEDPEDPCTGGRILIPGSHPGYITVEQYERNGARLVANRNMYGGARHRGSAREGKSLLQGIVLCGKCGRPMNVTYRSDRSWAYTCRRSATRRTCQEVHSRHVDPLVEALVLETVSREELHLAVGALEKLAERAYEMDQQWKKRIEGARYEAEKAARRYHQVEPENRLVVRTLETEWNERLEEVEQLEKEYEQVRQSLPFKLTEEQRRNVLALAEDLPRLWKAPTTRNSQRKRLLRLLIEDITLRNVDDPWSTEVAIRWKTGVVSRHRAERVQPHPQTTSPEAVARIQELYVKMTDQEVADALNAEGHRSGYGKEFTVESVSSIRQTRGMIKPRGWRKPSWNPNEPPKEDDHGHN
jgi:DNA invertase Pin-like site-specific DNA recombinase